MHVHDLKTVLAGAAEMVSEDGNAMFGGLGDFNCGHAWVGRYKGESDWACHADGDALVQTIEEEAQLRLLDDAGEHSLQCPSGTVHDIPHGTWHKYISSDWVNQFGALAGVTLHSTADDPRVQEG